MQELIACWKCGYERLPTDDGPEWACPRCGAALNKAESPAKIRQKATEAVLKTAFSRPKSDFSLREIVLAVSVFLVAVAILAAGLRFIPWEQLALIGANLTNSLGILVLVLGGYFLPPIIAFHRHHPDRWAILVVTIFFGVTLIGWVIPLAWALRGIAHTPKQR